MKIILKELKNQKIIKNLNKEFKDLKKCNLIIGQKN